MNIELSEMTPDDEKAADGMRAMFGPLQVDQQIRQAVELCWNMLPSDQKNLEQLEVAMGRIVKQELAKFRETNPPFDVSSSH